MSESIHDQNDDTQVLPVHVRRKQMLRRIQDSEFVRVSELSDEFNISAVTVRTDLDALSARGRIHRIRGGAVPRALGKPEAPLDENAGAHTAEKTAIGAATVQMISNGESILIDAGSTTTATAQALADRTDLKDVTVFTNGLTVALALEAAMPRVRTIVIGGTLRAMQHSLVEPLSSGILDRVHADVVIAGCNGIDPDAGMTNLSLRDAEVKQRMLDRADRRIFVADGSKIGKVALYRLCAADEVDHLVTGASANSDVLDALRDRGLDVTVADWSSPVTTAHAVERSRPVPR